ncbi:MAG TPA: hypothetical protein V6C72_08045, partial [Chroococcales cyanobacterium]
MRLSVMRAALLAGTFMCFAGSMSSSGLTGSAFAQSHRYLAQGDTSDKRDGFPQCLDQADKMSAADQEALLRQILDSSANGGNGNHTRMEAAYVLARVLQKSTPSPPSRTEKSQAGESPVGAKPDRLSEAYELYLTASHLDALTERSLWHAVEVATLANDEKNTRNALNELLGYYAGQGSLQSAGTPAGAMYALAQSYIRT